MIKVKIAVTLIILNLIIPIPIRAAEEAGNAQDAAEATEVGTNLENQTIGPNGQTLDPSPSPQVNANMVTTTEAEQNNGTNSANTLDGSALTGANDASRNVGNSSVTTGDANATSTLISSTNSSNFEVKEKKIEGEVTGDVDLSDNSIFNMQTKEINTNQTNDARLENTQTLIANSGDNTTSYNVGNSTITTGDANVGATVINLANSLVTGVAYVVDIFGTLIGDILLPNNVTIEKQNSTEIDQSNTANLINNIYLNSNTGNNETSSNTGGNSKVESGNTNTSGKILNVANSNTVQTEEPLYLVLINNMGVWQGENHTTNTTLSSVTLENFNIEQTNRANITNALLINANTGNNEASFNTGGNNTIKTGDVNVAASIVNFINANYSGRNVILGVVNVFGKWFGNILPKSLANQETTGPSINSTNTSTILSHSQTSETESKNELTGNTFTGNQQSAIVKNSKTSAISVSSSNNQIISTTDQSSEPDKNNDESTIGSYELDEKTSIIGNLAFLLAGLPLIFGMTMIKKRREV